MLTRAEYNELYRLIEANRVAWEHYVGEVARWGQEAAPVTAVLERGAKVTETKEALVACLRSLV
jgi:hypothetical protein